MNEKLKEEKVITFADLVQGVNNVSFGHEVVAFDVEFANSSDHEFPLRVDALLIVLTEQGSGRIGIDLREYDIEAGELILIQPRNYIYFSQSSDHCRAKIVACARETIDAIIPKMTDVLPLLLHHRTEPATALTSVQVEALRGFYDFLKGIIGGGPTPFLRHKVRAVLQAALYELMDIMKANIPDNFRKTRKEEIMGRFLKMLSENFRHERQVSYYADQLCITPKHLSAVVKEISGQTAGQWIEKYVVLESKVLLRTTDLSVQEISSRLNFPNQSFFGKYFKHITGMSPTSYRCNGEL